MDQKLSFKSKYEFIIDRYCDNFNRVVLNGQMPLVYKNYYNYFLHLMTCSLYPEYKDEITGSLCNKLRREKKVEISSGSRYTYIFPLRCLCGYTFIDLDRDKPDWDQTLVEHLAGTLISALSLNNPAHLAAHQEWLEENFLD